MSPAVAPFGKESGIFGMAEHLGGVGHGGIGNGIFHVVAAGFAVKVAGDVAILLAKPLAALVQHDGGLAGGVGPLIVNSGKLLHNGIGHGNDAGISHHAVGLVPHQMPNGEFPLRVEDVQHGVHHIGPELRVDDVIQRHGGAVRIPKGIGCIRRLLVDVGEQRRRNHRVIEGRVEHFAGRFVIRVDTHFC